MKKFTKVLCIIAVFILLFCSACSKADTTENLFDFKISINGNEYTLPQDVNTFTQNGWSFPDDFDTEKEIPAKNLESTFLTADKEENWIKIELFNNSDSSKKLNDCPVGRIEYYFEGDVDLITAGNFLLNGKTQKDIISKYGKPYSEAEYSTYTEIIYDKNPDSSIYDRYTFRFDKETGKINYLDMTMFDL